MKKNERLVRWVGPALRELRALPEPVQAVTGFALYQAQQGDKQVDAKPLKGFRGASVLEVVIESRGDTYRVVYTHRNPGFVYVLCAFQKKAQRGLKTPDRQVELIHSRLRTAAEHLRLSAVGRR